MTGVHGPGAAPDTAGVDRAHAHDVTTVLNALGATRDGLSGAQAAARLATAGPNRLPTAPRRPAVLRFASHFDDVLVYILLVAAALKAFLGDWVDFTVILAVAVVNALVGFLQEGQARRALDGIRTMLSPTATVRRDGGWTQVDAQELVPGDVVRLGSGDKVPADLRLLTATNLLVDESALTGESVPAAKDVAAVDAAAGVGDRTSMVFSGTIVAAGRGRGVVTATGTGTQIGHIQALVADVRHVDTPLERQLSQLGVTLSRGILALAVVMLVVGRAVHGIALPDLVSAAIGFAVAAVPEGLPALVTITLALGVQQMAGRNAITRKLVAVEALGSVTTICSDKTGTLTRNEMTARSVVTAARTYTVTGQGYEPTGHVESEGATARLDVHEDLAALLRTAVLCNDARVLPDDAGRWGVVGQPTEGALRTLALKAGVDTAGSRRVAAVPFESATKLSATLDAGPDDALVVHVVGAPDRLLDRAVGQRGPTGGTQPLDRDRWDAAVEELGARGLRVLAAARRTAAPGTRALGVDDVQGLTFLGVVGIVDPPRPEAVTAIASCRRAGVAVKMITGDHVGTAAAVARELGIGLPGGDVRALSGADLEGMDDAELHARVRDVDVFARTSPEHKIRIVEALQRHGEVVAMTGDGVNDAPALTRADVGIAMGVKGTEATKEAAEIVLADDDFATIERAVEEGRRIYDNIRKSVVFLLPTNGAQSLVILVAVLLGLTLPLTPVQILWVNLVTAVTLSLALAYEPAEPGVMDRPPRSPTEPVLSRPSLVLVVWTSLLIGGATLGVHLVAVRAGADAATARTAAVTTLVLAQIAFLLSCRFLGSSGLTPRVLRGNPAVWVTTGALLVLQVVFTYAPFMHAWFGSAPLPAREWVLTAAVAVGVFLLSEVGKVVARRVAVTPASAPGARTS